MQQNRFACRRECETTQNIIPVLIWSKPKLCPNSCAIIAPKMSLLSLSCNVKYSNLVELFVRCMTDWMADWLVADRLTSRTTNQPQTDWPTDLYIDGPADHRLTSRTTDRPQTDWSTNLLTDKQTNKPTSQPTDRPQTDQPIDWQTDRQTNCRLTDRPTYWRTSRPTDQWQTDWPTYIDCQAIRQADRTQQTAQIDWQLFTYIN